MIQDFNRFFHSVTERIIALGYSRESAEVLAGSLGDAVEMDAATGKLIAYDEHGQPVLLPMSVLGEDAE